MSPSPPIVCCATAFSPATDHSPFRTGAFVADPANANGNGNGGHGFGTGLTDHERWAIIEYMKTC